MERPRTNKDWLPTWFFALLVPLFWLGGILDCFWPAARALAESVRRGTPWTKHQG
jgi:hypothetical protein